MTNFAIYKQETGELVSLGTVIADPLPPELAAVEVSDEAEENRVAGWGWDPTELTFSVEPPTPTPEEEAAAAEQVMEQINDVLTAAGFQRVT